MKLTIIARVGHIVIKADDELVPIGVDFADGIDKVFVIANELEKMDSWDSINYEVYHNSKI